MWAALSQATAAHWSYVHTVREIPDDIRKALVSHFGDDDRLADVGEPFDAGCIRTGRPDRRLVWAANKDTHWFIAYEHGGFAHHTHFVVLAARAGGPIVVSADAAAGTHGCERNWRGLPGDDFEMLLAR
ncbi:MAG TPA: hypothetical protein VJ826_03410 [Candidatus Polarisedimenticolaceae bacterium]|nr:hypothetical protein [Candidatus Polarisedimenticolaceae bacterium]